MEVMMGLHTLPPVNHSNMQDSYYYLHFDKKKKKREREKTDLQDKVKCLKFYKV